MRQLIPGHRMDWLREESATFDGGRELLARDYGFADWAELEAEVERRRILDDCDVDALRELISAHPQMAVRAMKGWCDHRGGPAPLSYVAMMRYDTAGRVWRDVPGAAELARLLLTAGAPVDGEPGICETPLMTAASYGDAAVAQILIDSGAHLEAVAGPDSGGVPGGTALRHAEVFEMTAVADVLIAAGARR